MILAKTSLKETVHQKMITKLPKEVKVLNILINGRSEYKPQEE